MPVKKKVFKKAEPKEIKEKKETVTKSNSAITESVIVDPNDYPVYYDEG